MKTVIETFQFWKDNKIDQHYTLTIEQLKEKFKKWLKTKDPVWIEYYSSEQIVLTFITAKDGLSSIHEQKELSDLVSSLKKVL